MAAKIIDDKIQVAHIPPEKWWKSAKWRLLKEYKSANGNVIVPAGFVTDGASIPWGVQWRFSPVGPYFGAAIVHDYVLTHGGGWSKANTEFREEMLALEVSSFDRVVIMRSVYAYAWVRATIKEYKGLVK